MLTLKSPDLTLPHSHLKGIFLSLNSMLPILFLKCYHIHFSFTCFRTIYKWNDNHNVQTIFFNDLPFSFNISISGILLLVLFSSSFLFGIPFYKYTTVYISVLMMNIWGCFLCFILSLKAILLLETYRQKKEP